MTFAKFKKCSAGTAFQNVSKKFISKKDGHILIYLSPLGGARESELRPAMRCGQPVPPTFPPDAAATPPMLASFPFAAATVGRLTAIWCAKGELSAGNRRCFSIDGK